MCCYVWVLGVSIGGLAGWIGYFLGGGRFAGLDRLWVGRSILGGSPHSLGA
jgi:hypothetical protein